MLLHDIFNIRISASNLSNSNYCSKEKKNVKLELRIKWNEKRTKWIYSIELDLVLNYELRIWILNPLNRKPGNHGHDTITDMLQSTFI